MGPQAYWCGECICEPPDANDVQLPRFANAHSEGQQNLNELRSPTASDFLGGIDMSGSIGLQGAFRMCQHDDPQQKLPVLEHRLSDLLSHKAGPYLQIEADLLRGVSLRSTLRGLGWLWRSHRFKVPDATWRRQWQTSRPVKTYKVFVSHTWKTSGLPKVLALMLSSCWWHALASWAVTCAAVIVVHAYVPSLPMPFSHCTAW